MPGSGQRGLARERKTTIPTPVHTTNLVPTTTRNRWLRALAIIALLALAILAGGRWSAIEAWVAAQGPWGGLAFVGIFVVLTVGCFPVSVLGVTGGLLYGPWWGLALVFGSVYLSGTIIFGLGRSVLGPWVGRKVAGNPRLRVLDAMAADRALRLNVLARLSPFNYGIVCYTLGAGRTRWPTYLLGLGAVLPSTAAQVWVGYLIGQARESAGGSAGVDAMKTTIAVAGALALLVLVWQVGRMGQSAWREAAQSLEDGQRTGKVSDDDAEA